MVLGEVPDVELARVWCELERLFDLERDIEPGELDRVHRDLPRAPKQRRHGSLDGLQVLARHVDELDPSAFSELLESGWRVVAGQVGCHELAGRHARIGAVVAEEWPVADDLHRLDDRLLLLVEEREVPTLLALIPGEPQNVVASVEPGLLRVVRGPGGRRDDLDRHWSVTGSGPRPPLPWPCAACSRAVLSSSRRWGLAWSPETPSPSSVARELPPAPGR